MLDPGRYFAEAIYFLQYVLAQLLWAVNRAALSIAVIAESVNGWFTANVGYFVELMVNALAAPLGGMFILALTALGFWYLLNNIVPTGRWVDPARLGGYALIAFFFFSSPIVIITMMEDLRLALNAGIDESLIDGAAGEIFDTAMDGTDTGLPAGIPDVNGDGAAASFDLVAAFMLVGNIDELDSSEFPVDFEAAFFPFGDPSTINLSDEADQELAKAFASDGIERLLFAGIAIPTAIAEHFLRLALTGVAMFLYAGVPIAMLFAFFVYTQAFLGAYLRQFINLLIETFMSVVIVSIMITLLAAAALQGVGLYIAASVIALIVIVWRIKSALKLAAAALDLFGGAMLTGGVGGMELARTGARAATGTAAVAGAALTGGATLAAGGAILASAAALRADERAGGIYLGSDPAKTDGRVNQLKALAGYALGRSQAAGKLIEGGHELRTLTRNFRDGEVQYHDPDLLDYLRTGASMSGFGSSPWLAMRLSPSLRGAFNEIGGSRLGAPRDAVFDGDGEPVELLEELVAPDERRQPLPEERAPDGPRGPWQDEPATALQRSYLSQFGIEAGEEITRGRASELLRDARGGRRILSAGPPAAGQTPADQFASLERALETLADALREMQRGQSASGRNPNEPAVQDVRIVSRDLDVDEDGQIDEPGTMTPDPLAAARAHPAAPDPKTDPLAAGSAIRLEPVSEGRRQLIDDTLARLADPDTTAGQAALTTLAVYTGEDNARLIQGAVARHSARAVQAAAGATAEQVGHYRAAGLGDEEILAAFGSGTAAAAIRTNEETPLTEAELAAVADMVLLPQRQLRRTALVAAVGQAAAAGATDERGVMELLGMPVGFGGQTGNVRGVLAGARALQLDAAELAQLAELIQDGLREAVQADLLDRGVRPETARDFVTNVAALPEVLSVPQTTAGRSEE